ncbi:MMPL family transporter [Calycomorphotria hydatis]|uniref:Membrane transport protein mmpL8 n=1 Tax=Calycomorphotria hydatis TaxID=2528027 RepID=A0A517T3Q1_9PLAN|nr:MMPL family transporter [Calycomorphotria hydatis]QDT63007.1 Membrane transport protein mmpL8 [Calycomorphotria hydatis]
MVFRALGQFVARYWWLMPVIWIAVYITLRLAAPPWSEVIRDGEFAYLPASSPSLRGEQEFNEVFKDNFLQSNIAVVARRRGIGPDGEPLKLTETAEEPLRSDYQFLDEVLIPRIRELLLENDWIAANADSAEDDSHVVASVATHSDSGLGELLKSRDGSAVLVLINLRTEYQEKANRPLITALDELTNPVSGTLRRERLIPPGLDLYLSGSAVVGNDLRQAAEDSAGSTHIATVVLVVVLLVLIYQAPLLAIIPLITVFMSVRISLFLLSIGAEAGAVDLFNGIKIYIIVVMYGAGIDYCMFLMARYKEELDNGKDLNTAIGDSIHHVGSALAASAGTTMVGLGMMVFAEFGKFRQAGAAMSFSLLIVLLGSITLTPALLRLFGRYAFWPRVPTARFSVGPSLFSPTNLVSRILASNVTRGFWTQIAARLVQAPGQWWLITVAAMLPFALVGVLLQDWLTYGLLSELPNNKLSVRGARAVEDHFPAGHAAPVTILLVQPPDGVNFAEPAGTGRIAELTSELWDRREEFGLADIRTVSAPLGVLRLEGLSVFDRRGAVFRAARYSNYYVSDAAPHPSSATRLDLIGDDSVFSHESMERLDLLEDNIRELLPSDLADSEVYFIGPTASIRDLRAVTGRDRIRIDILVLAGVFAVLVLLLRNVAISAYLIGTVFFSFLVTLGFTYVVFWLFTPDFPGLDWKVPIFLFTILVAIGEDYNIYLVTRVREEQARLSPVRGVTSALAKTGGIISGCGVIMAGTFSSLTFGSLTGMVQLGFALACGVLLDTFIVRPILVPAYLIMLNRGDFGDAGRWLGAEAHAVRSTSKEKPTSDQKNIAPTEPVP